MRSLCLIGIVLIFATVAGCALGQSVLDKVPAAEPAPLQIRASEPSAITGALASQKNISACHIAASPDICLILPPYNASPLGYVRTTTAAPFAPGTSGTVASCTSFSAGQGILIPGAGSSGRDYVGTILFCSRTTLTVSPATSTRVSGGMVVQHDETAAFRSAIAALAATKGGGTIYLPDGTYLVNGPLEDTRGANAIIPMPAIPNYTTPLLDITIRGFDLPNWVGGSGATIETSGNSGNLFGGYSAAAGGGLPGFTNVKLQIENLSISLPANPGIVAVNATHLLAFQGRHMLVSTSSGQIPTNPTGGGIYMPTIGNQVQNALDDIQMGGLYNSYRLTEHTRVGSIYAVNCANAFIFDTGTSGAGSPQLPANYTGNSINVQYLWSMHCNNVIVGTANPTTINVQTADIELPNNYGIYDPSNGLHGILNFHNPYAKGPQNSGDNCSTPINGAGNLQINALFCKASNWGLSAGANIPTTAPTLSAGAAIGSGYGQAPHLNTTRHNTDQTFEVSFSTGSYGGTAGFLFVATFGTPFSASPACTFSPADANAVRLSPYVFSDSNPRVFALQTVTPLPANTTYTINVSCPRS